MRKESDKMKWKAIDMVVGEIVEADDLHDLISNLQARWEGYIAEGCRVAYYCGADGVRYLAQSR